LKIWGGPWPLPAPPSFRPWKQGASTLVLLLFHPWGINLQGSFHRTWFCYASASILLVLSVHVTHVQFISCSNSIMFFPHSFQHIVKTQLNTMFFKTYLRHYFIFISQIHNLIRSISQYIQSIEIVHKHIFIKTALAQGSRNYNISCIKYHKVS
jgi:hypothetical protein